jgi:serine protease
MDVIADVGGWFTDASATGTGAGFNPLAPVRILDTRGINGQPVPAGGQIAPVGQTPLKLQVAGATDGNGTVLVPSMSSATPPRAVVINVTVTDTVTDSGGSFLTVWPDGVPEPGISDLNFKAGLTIPNLVVVKVGSDGKIAIANAKGTADVVVDIVGWYS